MVKCQLCTKEKPTQLPGSNPHPLHMLLTIDSNNHVHVHAPFENKPAMRIMLNELKNQLELNGIFMILRTDK